MVFLWKKAMKWLRKKHANSMTYLMEDVNGNHAWGTYIMTPLTEKYKSYDFLTQIR